MGLTPKNGKVAEPGFNGVAPGRGDKYATRFGLPPSIDNRTLFLPGISMVPPPGFGINRFAYASEDTQARHLVFARPFLSGCGNSPDRRGRSVKLIDLPLLNHLPIPVRVRVSRNAFEHGRRGPVGQGTVNDIRMPSDPTDVSRAKIDAFLVVVENVLVGNCRINHVAGGRVKNPFGLPVDPEV